MLSDTIFFLHIEQKYLRKLIQMKPMRGRSYRHGSSSSLTGSNASASLRDFVFSLSAVQHNPFGKAQAAPNLNFIGLHPLPLQTHLGEFTL